MGDKAGGTQGQDTQPKPGQRTVDNWLSNWTEGSIGFHRDVRHTLLVKHVDRMINGRSGIKIFFPLCGKSLDMKWMYDQGHVVVGVEVARQAMEEFFKENNIDYTTEHVEAIDGTLYKNNDGRLRLYCCDIYKFNVEIESEMDGIWDRGSLVAINKEDRERYTDLIISLMAPSCRYLLCTPVFDSSIHLGPPHYVSEEEVVKRFGPKCTLKIIDFQDALTDRYRSWGLDSFFERLYLIELIKDAEKSDM